MGKNTKEEEKEKKCGKKIILNVLSETYLV